MQSKKQSFIESITNVLIGFVISILASFIIFPICGVKTSALQNIGATILFTITSILRQYIIRRRFNKKEVPYAVELKVKSGEVNFNNAEVEFKILNQ